jgi:uncharacterized protein
MNASLRATAILSICIALTLSIGATAQGAIKFLSIATGGSGGTYYIVGGGMGKVIEKYIPGVKVSVESTAASTENCRLVASKQVKFAIVMPDSAYFAFNGGREFGDKKYTNLRGIMAGHTSAMHFIVTKKSAITSLGDLRGKRVALSAPGSTTEFMAEAALEAYGLTRKDYKPILLTYSEQIDALRDGTIDMACVSAGAPASSALDIASTNDVVFLGLGPEELKKVIKKHPYWTAGVIAAGTYKGQSATISTITNPTMLITNAEMDTETVYSVIKTLTEHTAELKAVHPQGAEWDLADAADGMAIPFHPGAEKFLIEKGILKKK